MGNRRREKESAVSGGHDKARRISIMKHLVEKAYAPQREFSWRIFAQRFEVWGTIIFFSILCALALVGFMGE